MFLSCFWRPLVPLHGQIKYTQTGRTNVPNGKKGGIQRSRADTSPYRSDCPRQNDRFFGHYALYAVGAMVFLYAEPFLKHLVKGAGLYVSPHQAWHELTLPRTWATMIWTVVLLLCS